MAIEAKNNNDLVQDFVNLSTELYNYTCSNNMLGNPKYDAKYSVKLGKSLDKVVNRIISSHNDMNEFIDLLDSKNLLTSYLVAEYLYPLYPKKCINIMKAFYNELEDKIDKYTVKTKIDGITSQESFFMDSYKELYNTDDLQSLNRESQEKCK